MTARILHIAAIVIVFVLAAIEATADPADCLDPFIYLVK